MGIKDAYNEGSIVVPVVVVPGFYASLLSSIVRAVSSFWTFRFRNRIPCVVFVAASFIPFLSRKQNLKNWKGTISCRVFAV